MTLLANLIFFPKVKIFLLSISSRKLNMLLNVEIPLFAVSITAIKKKLNPLCQIIISSYYI